MSGFVEELILLITGKKIMQLVNKLDKKISVVLSQGYSSYYNSIIETDDSISGFEKYCNLQIFSFVRIECLQVQFFQFYIHLMI